MEIFKLIPSTVNCFASNYGNIKGVTGKVLKQVDTGKGYMAVTLCFNGIPKRHYVHRLVAATFLDNKENKPEVNHIDGVRHNNNLINLEWVTRSENHFHRYEVLKKPATNKGKFGSLNWLSKKVGMYKDNMLIKEYPAVMEASRDLNISESSIRCCITGRTKLCIGHTFKYI